MQDCDLAVICIVKIFLFFVSKYSSGDYSSRKLILFFEKTGEAPGFDLFITFLTRNELALLLFFNEEPYFFFKQMKEYKPMTQKKRRTTKGAHMKEIN